MAKVLAVFGATGKQGGSVVNYVLNDPELSKRYKIRAITRDVNSEQSKQLKNVEVVQGDVLDPASLDAALTGVHTIFLMTAPSFGPDRFDVEYNSVKAVADLAINKGVEYIIFSTLPDVIGISGGKYTKVTPFDAKAAAEQYIRRLPIKSAFYCPGSFMENFHTQPFLNPRQAPDGTWVMARHTSPKTQFPLIDAVGDSGKFVGAILNEPDGFEGKRICGATKLYTLEEIVAILSKATGKTIVYKQIPLEEFRDGLMIAFGGMDIIADIYVEAFSYGEEFGYYGPDTEKQVAWAAEQARGTLSTFEEYLAAHPLQLE
jgi:uncharacterized protein YbjT (DUF2867 family)